MAVSFIASTLPPAPSPPSRSLPTSISPWGPYLRQDIREDTGPVRARIDSNPISKVPTASILVFSAFTHLYITQLPDGIPHRLTTSTLPEFDPAWSPDGRSIVYITWTAIDGGNIWRIPSDGSGPPTRLTDHPDFYRNPVFCPRRQNHRSCAQQLRAQPPLHGVQPLPVRRHRLNRDRRPSKSHRHRHPRQHPAVHA